MTWGTVNRHAYRGFTVRPDLWPLGSDVVVDDCTAAWAVVVADWGQPHDHLDSMAAKALNVGMDKPGVAEAMTLAGWVNYGPACTDLGGQTWSEVVK